MASGIGGGVGRWAPSARKPGQTNKTIKLSFYKARHDDMWLYELCAYHCLTKRQWREVHKGRKNVPNQRKTNHKKYDFLRFNMCFFFMS